MCGKVCCCCRRHAPCPHVLLALLLLQLLPLPHAQRLIKPALLALRHCRFGDDAHDTLFATVHDLDAVFDTHEALEQQKPEHKRGKAFVVSPWL